MSRTIGRRGWLLLLVATAGVAILLPSWSRHASKGGSAPAAQTTRDETGRPLTPPERMRIRAATHPGSVKDILLPAAAAWDKAGPTHVLLSRTPRLYQRPPAPELVLRVSGSLALGTTSPLTASGFMADTARLAADLPPPAPALEVRGLRCDQQLVVRLRWSDTTRNAPVAPPAKTGEGGDPKLLYKRPTTESSTFADAAAVMAPEKWSGPSFPALLMGDKSSTMRIAYWNASRGAEELSASGRATPIPTGKALDCHPVHADGMWTLTLAVPLPPVGYPLAFAVWDGEFGDRDGLKFISPWYVLMPE